MRDRLYMSYEGLNLNFHINRKLRVFGRTFGGETNGLLLLNIYEKSKQ